MVLLSKGCKYGIRAALYVASQNNQEFVPIRKISEDLNISFHFLTKILQMLTHKNIMASYRGPHGGVLLARPADEITLMDMIKAIEGEDFLGGCALALPGCDDKNPCPFHEYWGECRDTLKTRFENTNLAELEKRIREEGLRIGLS